MIDCHTGKRESTKRRWKRRRWESSIYQPLELNWAISRIIERNGHIRWVQHLTSSRRTNHKHCEGELKAWSWDRIERSLSNIGSGLKTDRLIRWHANEWECSHQADSEEDEAQELKNPSDDSEWSSIAWEFQASNSCPSEKIGQNEESEIEEDCSEPSDWEKQTLNERMHGNQIDGTSSTLWLEAVVCWQKSRQQAWSQC